MVLDAGFLCAWLCRLAVPPSAFLRLVKTNKLLHTDGVLPNHGKFAFDYHRVLEDRNLRD
jgi:hypothetical protein